MRNRRALDEVHNIVREAAADGTKYVPDQMASVQKELGELQSSYDQKDYATVLAHAPAVLVDAKALAADATTRKGEFAKALDTEWRGFAAFLPQWIKTVKDRVDEISKPKPVLRGIDLAVAKSGLANATDGWRRAQATIASGEVDNAIATAKDVRSEIEAAAAALKVQLPGADREKRSRRLCED